MRDALFAAALDVSIAAALRARRRAGPALALAAGMLSVVAFAAARFLLPPSGGAPARRPARWAFAWPVLVATAPLFFGGPYPDAVPLERLLS